MSREQKIKNIVNEHFDVVVIGGGATGLGCALDATLRGAKCLLIEQRDFGSGSSSKSTKLIHGGVRYLEQGNIPLVYEGLKERGRLFQNASELIKKQRFVIPLFRTWEKIYYGIGLKLYDLLAHKWSIGPSKVLSKKEVLEFIPGLNEQNLKGGVSYWDGKFDDTQLLMSLVKSIDREGGQVLNYAELISFNQDESGKINGITWRDNLSNSVYQNSCTKVVNATGVFVEKTASLVDSKAPMKVRPSRGSHITIDGSFINQEALLIPKTKDGRLLFVIPWKNEVIIGTTDIEDNQITLDPICQEEEIEYILETCNRYFKNKIERKNINSVFSGLRPLVSKHLEKASTSKLSRSHLIRHSESGLISIGGGKWTTFRKMAEDVIDLVIKTSALNLKACQTTNYSLALTPDYDDLITSENGIKSCIANEYVSTIDDLLHRRSRIGILDDKKVKAWKEKWGYLFESKEGAKLSN